MFGNVSCEVMDCSSEFILCITKSAYLTYSIKNYGYDPSI